MKDYLIREQKRLEAKKAKLLKRSQESENIDEVRSINDELNDIIEQLTAISDQLAKMDEEGSDNEERSAVPAQAQLVNGEVRGQFPQASTESREADFYGSMEYRKAFMKYAQTGAPIEMRDGAPANTTSLGATIPTTVLNEFINEIREVYGNLYAKVRKLNIKGAVKIPISKLEASFKWVTEDTVSPRQDGGEIKDFVEFSYNMAEIRVSQTLLSEIVSLDIFEREVVNIMMKAYLKAMDTGIVKGTGNGQMLGIVNDTRITTLGNVVEMTANDMNNWTAWRKKFFAKLPLGYRSGEFIFPVATVDAYLETMADANNNPVYRQATGLEVNDGDSRNPNGRFFGHEVALVEPDVIKDFDTASNGDIVGIFWNPEEYAINTNLEFGVRRYFDEERNEWVNKMLTIVDGKPLNPRAFMLIKKKA